MPAGGPQGFLTMARMIQQDMLHLFWTWECRTDLEKSSGQSSITCDLLTWAGFVVECMLCNGSAWWQNLIPARWWHCHFWRDYSFRHFVWLFCPFLLIDVFVSAVACAWTWIEVMTKSNPSSLMALPFLKRLLVPTLCLIVLTIPAHRCIWFHVLEHGKTWWQNLIPARWWHCHSWRDHSFRHFVWLFCPFLLIEVFDSMCLNMDRSDDKI